MKLETGEGGSRRACGTLTAIDTALPGDRLGGRLCRLAILGHLRIILRWPRDGDVIIDIAMKRATERVVALRVRGTGQQAER